ncbi:MAG: MBL fold metallo-hydrolase [bacterium]|nr:MBL fold metallo-hydrolase [bacterium]
MNSSNRIKLSFLGGASSIGASCALLEVAQTKLVIDCGVRFEAHNPLPDLSQLSGVGLDAIVLTHAHSDHSGGLPVLCEAHPATPVYTTPPTRDLAAILFQDALKLMHSPERDTEIPLYAHTQVERLLENMLPIPFGDRRRVKDVIITLLPASHILGAAMVHLQTPEGNILFTGDFSVSSQLTVPALQRPSLHVDMIVSESTYGSRLHEDRRAAEERLIAQIRTVVENQGRVLIPAFAVGRAQEVLLILKRALRNRVLPAIPVFVDGMVRRVCDVYGQYESYVTRTLARDIRHADHPFYTHGIIPVHSFAERDKALGQRPSVVVASSGMLSGGASVVYASAFAAHDTDAILITGYQDEESPGRALLRLAAGEGERRLKLGDRIVDVQCHVDIYGLSAHADRMQIVGLIEAMRPRTVVLVHGDGEARRSLATGMSCNDVVVAENGQVVERAYTVRKSALRGVAAWVDSMEIDFDIARHALGPPSSAPIRATQIAEAWFGERVKADVVNQFVVRLEDMGLVRRDDQRRQMLWILGPGESDVFTEEAELEARLKADNPKGRLLELCMRMKIEAPLAEFSVAGAFHVARMTLTVQRGTIDSGEQCAPSKRTAEQRAAETILKQLKQEPHEDEGCVEVEAQRYDTLRRENPKGVLLEWCAKGRFSTPQFEEKPDLAGFRVRVSVQIGIQTWASQWYSASTLRTAQQSAAADLLGQMHTLAATERPQQPVVEQPSEDVPSSSDARVTLNEMKQQGLISDFGYEQGETLGPSHQPVFTLRCWAITPLGNQIDGPDVQAASKKTAQRDSAAQLLHLLLQLEHQ